MKVIIDRFEGNYAVCEKEDNTIINISISKIPNNAKEGNVLDIHEDIICIDNTFTNNRQKLIKKLIQDTWEN